MTQQSGNQYDDDLTVGTDSSGAFQTDSVDLLGSGTGEETSIARLKSIILSIDWEITDEILNQLDEELVDLGEILAGDKIKQVYIQGLSKIGRYIYKEKANAHPDSIKLLITFFHNLEKIDAAGDSMTDEEKKELLRADVKKFDQLKAHIVQAPPVSPGKQDVADAGDVESEIPSQMKALKAQILGIDWEINDQELQKLDDEVQRLQAMLGDNRAQSILLQGIGALSSYVSKRRSLSNGQAFTLIHSFYDLLEKVTATELPPDEEKELILAEVEKFNAFKAKIASEPATGEPVSARAEDSSAAASEDVSTEESGEESSDITAEVGDEEIAADVESRLDSVFGADDGSPFVEDESEALEGVDVETEADDDSDEDALPYDDSGIAPALSSAGMEEEESSLSDDFLAEEEVVTPAATEEVVEAQEVVEEVVEEESVVDEISQSLASSFGEDEGEDLSAVRSDSGTALEGVDVETEADDDSDEAALPTEGGELAPALAGSEEEGGFGEESQEGDDAVPGDLEDRLGAFFDDEEEPFSSEDHGQVEEDSDEGFVDKDDLVAGLTDFSEDDELYDDESLVDDTESLVEQEAEEELSFLDEDVPAPASVESEEVELSEEAAEDAGYEGPAPALSDESFEDVASVSEEEEADETPVAASEEVASVEEDTEEALSLLDEDAPVETPEEEEPALEAESSEEALGTDELPSLEEEVEESVEQELSFLDEETEPPVTEETGEDDLLTTEEPVEEEKAEAIDFTVPGEEAAFAESEMVEEEVGEEEGHIEFDVPGEELMAGAAFAAHGEEVVFEVVDDDVEVDQLPGEEFVELESGDLPGDEDGGKYPALGAVISRIKTDISVDDIQELSYEILILQDSAASSDNDKMFLKMLSVVARHNERSLRSGGDGQGLKILEDIYGGLEMSDPSDEEIQARLLTCMNKVMDMQENEIDRLGLGN